MDLACGLGALSSGARRSRRKGYRTTEDGADWLEAYLAGSRRTPRVPASRVLRLPGTPGSRLSVLRPSGDV